MLTDSLNPPSTAATATTVENVRAVRMGLCRFGAKTVKLLLLLFLKQILEVGVQHSVKKEQMEAVWSNSFEI